MPHSKQNDVQAESHHMSAALKYPDTDLTTQLTQLERASAHLIARLSDRAAYASGEEFDEIRALITMLRGLVAKP